MTPFNFHNVICAISLWAPLLLLIVIDRSSLAVAFSLSASAAKIDSAPASPKKGVVVGVDYYPEQWPPERMEEDMRSIKEDLGADMVRVGEFMWSSIEPQDGVFDFALLDSILEAAKELGLKVMLGTPTATMPSWLYNAYADEIAQVGPDSPNGYAGKYAAFGGRRQYSFNYEVYRNYAYRVVKQLEDRYASRTDLIHSWQVDSFGRKGS